MRSVVVYEFMALDGVAEDVGRFFRECDDEAVDPAGTGRRRLDGLPPMGLTPIRSVISPTGCLILDHQVVA